MSEQLTPDAETYLLALVCCNCRHKWQVQIPRGKVVNGDVHGHCYWDWGQWIECPHCGAVQHGPANDVETNDRIANGPSQHMGEGKQDG